MAFGLPVDVMTPGGYVMKEEERATHTVHHVCTHDEEEFQIRVEPLF